VRIEALFQKGTDCAAGLILRSCWVDQGFDFVDGVGGEAALGGVVADGLFVGGDVDAVDLVLGDVALDPLNFGAHVAEDAAGLLRNCLEVAGREVASIRDVPFNYVLWHRQDFIPFIGGVREMTL
jgi:hypothetical protein